MESTNHSDALRWNARLATSASFVLVSIMMACVVSTGVQILQLINPAFQGGYLIPICVLVGLEASFGQRRMKYYSFPQPEWIAYRIAEFTVLIIGLRLLFYWLNGIDQLWVDLGSWPEGFLESVFNREYMLALFLALFAWGANHILAEELLLMEADENRLNVEMMGVEVEERSAAQQNLRDTVVFIGSALILATAVVRFASRGDPAAQAAMPVTQFNVIVYFLLALVLFSLTNFSVLRMSWVIQHGRIKKEVASRWILYGLVFIALLAILASLLPTSYSTGFLTTLSYLFYGLLNVLRILISILLLPFILFINWIMSLFRSTERIEAPAPLQQPIIPPNQPLFQADWLEVLKSIVFWSTLIGLVIFSIYYFLKENRDFAARLKRLPFALELLSFFQRLVDWIKRINHQMTATITAGIERLRRSPTEQPSSFTWGFTNPRNLTPRGRVIFFYLAMLRRGSEKGVPRKAGQTPYEYAQTLEHALQPPPDVTVEPSVDIIKEIDSLTEEFVEARYSRHEVTTEQASLARRYWEHIRYVMQQWLHSRKLNK